MVSYVVLAYSGFFDLTRSCDMVMKRIYEE